MSGSDNKDPGIKVKFSPDPGITLYFRGMHAVQELGHPFLFNVDLSSDKLQDATGLIGASVTLTMIQSAAGTATTYFNGIVTKAISSGMVAGAYRYKIEARPWIWLLTRTADCKIFQNQTAFDIITTVFRNNNFSDFKDNRKAGSGDITLEYCVQYRETSFDFVTRLMEQFGIYYFFQHEDGKHTLVLADDPNSHEKLPNAIPFGGDQLGTQTVADHVNAWNSAASLESAKYTFRDYNFTTPSADLTAKTIQTQQHPYGSMEVYDYPGPYDEVGNGSKLTDVRMQAIGMQRSVVESSTNSRVLHPGAKFSLSGHPDKSTNRDYLITKSEFSLTSDESSSGTDGKTSDTYRSKISKIPDDVNFRLERKTPRPMIRGPQTAVVDGESGEEITTDQYGRVKVKFYWDRSDAGDNQHTCWIRVAQSSAGAGWGSMFIPRKGQEVVVNFLEGNPDRPLITGVVYNANMTVPYGLPDNKTRSTIKTNSSQGGNGFNELRFEDKAGSEEVFFQAQKDYTKKVLNNETVTVHKDTTTTVETGNRTVTVSQGGDSLTVSTGDHTITVSAGKSSVTAAQSITLSVGANSITIDTSGITVNGMQISMQANTTMSLQAGASLSATAAMISLN